MTKITENNKKTNLDFLIEDVLSCLFGNTGECLIEVLNSYKISKDSVIKVFRNEIRKDKPDFRILLGALIVLENQLRKWQKDFYCVIETLSEIKYCFIKDQRKTIRKCAAVCIFRLFLSLWCESKLAPEEIKNSLNKFRDIISKQDIKNIVELIGGFKEGNLLKWRFIFEEHGLKFDITNPEKEERKLNEILKEFYR